MECCSNHGDTSLIMSGRSVKEINFVFQVCFQYFLSFTIHLNCVPFSDGCFCLFVLHIKLLLCGGMANTDHVVLGTIESYRDLFNAQEICTCKI